MTDDDEREVSRANAAIGRPVVFLHGLWLLPHSWQRWADVFEAAGYAALTPGWPGEASSETEAHAMPDMLAGTTIRQVADRYEELIRRLNRKPVLIGHSFGGLVAQMLAGEGLAKVTVAIEPAPFRGMLPLPAATLEAVGHVLDDRHNRNRAAPLSFDQFRRAFANAVEETEAAELYEQFAVAAPGKPLFQAAAANRNPWTEAKVNGDASSRGPLLIIAGERDQTFPPEISRDCYEQQRANPRETEFVTVADRGHSITIDHGWREVSNIALEFVERFTAPR